MPYPVRSAFPGCSGGPSRRGQGGYSSGTGLVAMAVGLILVAVILVFALNPFGGAAGGGRSGGTPSILSPSSAETQIKLCSEGRPSSYGNPPTDAQQAKCIQELIGEVASGGSGSGLTAP